MVLEGRVAIVTGASSGIGEATAMALARAGSDVVINYVGEEDKADSVCTRIESLGRRSMIAKADISQENQVSRLIEEAVTTFGKIDILVNNAGVQVNKCFVDLTSSDWDKMLAVDLRGTFLVTLYAVREMFKFGSGKIVNITSVHQYLPKPGFAPYCVAKAGVGMLTQVLATELAPHKININAIAPGAIDTPMNKDLMQNADLRQKLIDEVPWGRVGRPEEVADLAVYLASSSADYITGATFVIDGGLSQLGARY